MAKTELYFTNMKECEVLKTNGDKRLVKRIRWNRRNTKKDIVDYCIQSKIYVHDNERWIIEYYNKSKTKVERRFLRL